MHSGSSVLDIEEHKSQDEPDGLEPEPIEVAKSSPWNATGALFGFILSLGVGTIIKKYRARHRASGPGTKAGTTWNVTLLLLELIAGGILALFSAIQIRMRYEVAKPNEWMLVIHNGRMLRSAIGLRWFREIGQTVVKFSSAIQKVEFDAQQVSKEMAGIQVKGFAIWSIYRQGEGPFKAYKYLDGLSTSGMMAANNNMAQMAESVIRHQIANLSINEVITQRDHIRSTAKKEMTAVARGWGIWIETVEVTDVRIQSNTLFENLQCEFRQKMRLEAESIQLSTQKDIDQQRTEIQLEQAKMQSDVKTRRSIYENEQQLKRDQETQKVEEQRQAIKLEQIKRENEIAMFKQKADAEAKQARAELEMKLEAEKSRHDNELQRAVIETEQTMNDTNLRRMLVETTERIYEHMPIREMKVINMNSGSEGGDSALTNMITGLAKVAKEVMQD